MDTNTDTADQRTYVRATVLLSIELPVEDAFVLQKLSGGNSNVNTVLDRDFRNDLVMRNIGRDLRVSALIAGGMKGTNHTEKQKQFLHEEMSHALIGKISVEARRTRNVKDLLDNVLRSIFDDFNPADTEADEALKQAIMEVTGGCEDPSCTVCGGVKRKDSVHADADLNSGKSN